MNKKVFIGFLVAVIVIITAIVYFNVLFFIMSLSFGEAGKTDNTKIIIESSSKFSEEEIQGAVSCFKEKFKKILDCELTELSYKEEYSNNYIDEELPKEIYGNIDPNNILILRATFKSGSNYNTAINQGFSTNLTYPWKWIFVRENAESVWSLKSYGGP